MIEYGTHYDIKVVLTASCLAGNPLEVLKVRMQTALPPTAAAAQPSTSRVGAGSRPPSSTREGLLMLWKTEGAKFLIAGAAAPILVGDGTVQRSHGAGPDLQSLL